MERSRKRNHYSPATSSLPHDLTLLILSKLPTKSVMRFRCVSKLWSSSITTEPYFNNLFETHSSKCPKLLVTFRAREYDKLFVFSISQRNEGYTYSQPMDSYRMEYFHHIPYITTGSVHGLICFLELGYLRVWNPSTRKCLTLPKHGMQSKSKAAFLGYDPLHGTHKVICMSQENDTTHFVDCRVLTLGCNQQLYWRIVQPYWRIVQPEYNHSPLTTTRQGVCIDGVLYYHAKRGVEFVIMSFDVRSEKFGLIKLPMETPWSLELISYEGKLACVSDRLYGHSMSVWVLVDASKHEWSCHRLSPLSHYGLVEDQFFLSGMTDNGELIFVGVKIHKELEIVYINLKRKMFRRVSYRGGMVGDEFRQCNGKETRHHFHFFPNHLETLMSL